VLAGLLGVYGISTHSSCHSTSRTFAGLLPSQNLSRSLLDLFKQQLSATMMRWFRSARDSSTANPSANPPDALDDGTQRRPPEIAGEPITSLPAHFVGASTTGDNPTRSSSVHSSSLSAISHTIHHDKSESAANWLHERSEALSWSSDHPGEGVFVKRSKGRYAYSPADLSSDSTGLRDAITALNIPVR
jgi:hypothetical protein